uniref:RING-type domain-containing protein n=1 Tax=Angiostrongylus cantonensis TaxID=6313 RepID=A0A0K0D572_ANGCA
MAFRCKGVHSCVEDDVQHGARLLKRAKYLANLRIDVQLMVDGEGTAELSRSSLFPTKTGIGYCKEVVDASSSEGDAETTSNACTICLVPETDPMLLDKCSHSFCFTCTSQRLKRAGKCPLCMTPVGSFSHNLDLPPGCRLLICVQQLKWLDYLKVEGLCILFTNRNVLNHACQLYKGGAPSLELIILHNSPLLVRVLSMKFAYLICSTEASTYSYAFFGVQRFIFLNFSA